MLMKKFITLLLVLTGMVSTAMADTVYLKPNNDWKGVIDGKSPRFAVYVYKDAVEKWYLMTEMSNPSGYYYANIDDSPSLIIFCRMKADGDLGWGIKANQTQDINSSSSPTYANNGLYEINGWNSCASSGTIFAVTPAPTLKYGISGQPTWSSVDLTVNTSTGVCTGTLDLSSTLLDRNFLLFISENKRGSKELILENTDGLATASATKGNDFTLSNSTSGYKTYTITATWVPNGDVDEDWKLKVENKDARTNDSYTVSFLKGRNWESVNAYVYNELDGVADIIAAWPGEAMTDAVKTEVADNGRSYDVWTYSFNSSFTPGKIIFSDGNDDDNKTTEFTYVDEKHYTEAFQDNEVYAAVGGDQTGAGDASHKSIFSGYWDSESTTDFMDLSADGTTYTFVKKDVVMDPTMTIYTKAISKATVSSTTGITWRPSGTDNETQITVPVKGIYDITITCTKDGTTVTGTATKTAEAVTVSNVDWATTVTNSALDFSGVAEIEAYTATVDAETVTLHKVDDVQAETGLVIMSKDDLAATETFYVPVKAGGSETAKGDLLFSSTATYTTYHTGESGAEYNRFYGLAVVDGKPRFAQIDCKAGDEKTIPAGKAFLKVNTGALVSAQELNVVFEDDSTTGINTVKTAQQKNDNAIYNLAGQRVAAPAKGLYIMNGKKVIMK